MKPHNPTITVVIATFNSEKLIGRVLSSVRNQDYPQNKVEIVIVDGGSTDTTLMLAKKYHCVVMENSHVEPVYGKYIGLLRARGRYVLYIDHDEVLVNRDSLKTRMIIFEKYKDVKAIVASGYRSPTEYQVINRYINEFGDPFSFFIYRLSKNEYFFFETMRRKFKVIEETTLYGIFDLSSSAYTPLIELSAGGGMIDKRFVMKHFSKSVTDYQLIAHLLHLIRFYNPHLAITRSDVILHFSSDTFTSYLSKLKWRVKNNIFFTKTVGSAGFSGREEYQSHPIIKAKYLFIPYAFSIIMPTIDSVHLILTRKDISYIMHTPLTLFTAILIIYYLILKKVGIHPVLTSYDGSTKAYEKHT